jgi:uncharacterized membrane protein (GlpM family)
VTQLVFRFLIGGIVVSLFATLADVLRPKSFAGLFGAAPSVALATLGLTIATEGNFYAAQESRSMIGGAIAFLVYAGLCSRLLIKGKFQVASITISALGLWLFCALSAWVLVLR